MKEVWIGLVEVRQLPGEDHQIMLSGVAAFTWVTCWADSVEAYELKVAEVMQHYGLFVTEFERVECYTAALDISDSLAQQAEETMVDEKFCKFGTLHSYKSDN